MIAAASAMIVMGVPLTTVEFFWCDFARITGYDANDSAVVSEERYPLFAYIRRESQPYSGSPATVLKVIDPTPLLSRTGLTATVAEDGMVTIYVDNRVPTDAVLSIKGVEAGRKDREGWVIRQDMTAETLDESPLFVGSCTSAQGAVAEKLLRESK